jgi:hypothetical protein
MRNYEDTKTGVSSKNISGEAASSLLRLNYEAKHLGFDCLAIIQRIELVIVQLQRILSSIGFRVFPPWDAIQHR